MNDEQAIQVERPSGGERRKRRARRRIQARRAARPRVLDVYGTVTGYGTAISAEEISASVLDALR